ncbi:MULTISPECIES: MFS transporter [Bacillus]|uniref:MFS transporter n=1 Tax=Bacillus TaxID=1386 RepID=UPI00030C71DE|nr:MULTISPECIES: MFS transporter [Bacillus]
MNKEKIWTKDFTSLCFSAFFIFLPFYALLTALPFFVLDELHGAKESVGLVISAFLLAAVLIRPFAGNWLDSIGRKKILTIALILLFIATALYLVVHTYGALLILRFVQGIGFGLATTATGAISADLVPASRRGEGIGYYGMFMSLAMVCGPYLGLTIIQKYSFTLLFAICVVCAIFSFLLGIIVKIPKFETKKVEKQKSSLKLSSIFELSAIPISVAAMVLAFSYSSILSYVSLFATEIGLADIAGMFFVIFAIVTVLSRPFTGKWFDLYGDSKVIYPALVLFMIGMAALSFTSNAFIYMLAAGIIGLGYGAIVPSFQTISIQYAAHNRRGMATATYFIFFDSGIGIGAYLNGILSAKYSYQTMYIICSAMILFTILLYYALYDRRKKHILEQSMKHVEA